MGYVPELGTAYKLKELVETLQVKMVSFELFLAKVECEQMLEIHSQVKDKGYSELDVVSERKSSAEASLLFFRTSQRCQRGIFLLIGHSSPTLIPSLLVRLPCFLLLWSRAAEPHMGSWWLCALSSGQECRAAPLAMC